jgi:glycosyltransferase involved in cell wall biosynthesis
MHGNGVSVIVPLYNKERSVARAIQSVISQEGVDEKEIIVVNDGSTDRSAEVARKFGDRITYVEQANRGPSAARNLGASMAKYRNLVFLDADDELGTGCLAAHMRCRLETPEVAVSIADFRVIQGDSIQRVENIRERLGIDTREHASVAMPGFDSRLVFNVASSTVCVERALYEMIGGFDAALRCWEISDFMYRLMLENPKVGLPPECYVSIHASGASGQFESTCHDTQYLTRFAHKLLDRVDDVPPAHRAVTLGHVVSALEDVASAGNIRDVKSIAARVYKYRAMTTRPRHIGFMAKMPCLHNVLYWFRRLVN